MMRILVTGGTGLVGTALKKIMPEAVYVSSAEYDLTKEPDVFKMYQCIKPTHVVHLAARVGGISDNITYPADFFDENIIMNTNVIRMAKLFKVERLIGIISSCSYPDKAEMYPLEEFNLFDGPPTPTNFSYAIAKRAMATQIDAYNAQYGTKYSYLIPCNIYGETEEYRDGKSHFIAALIKKVYDADYGDRVVRLMGDGSPLRQHLYVGDFARIIKEAIERDLMESFNVAPNENLSIREIAEMLTESKGLKLEFDPTKPNGQYRKDISNYKFKQMFPDFKFTPLREGLNKCYTYYEQNKINQ